MKWETPIKNMTEIVMDRNGPKECVMHLILELDGTGGDEANCCQVPGFGLESIHFQKFLKL